jgi:selenocysteine lyase/cysteine desulfurase
VPVVRISPHYYNTREEVAELANAIEGLLREEKP